MKNTRKVFAAMITVIAVIGFVIATIACDNTNGTSAHVHDWGDWVQTKVPTETEEGEETRTCKLDPTHTEKRPIAKLSAHVHIWGDWVRTTPPTCTQTGEETRTCTLDATHKETRLVIARGHDWGEWTITTPATTTAPGEETRTCKHDATYKETRVIPQITFSGADDLGNWLSGQPSNNAETPYAVTVRINNENGFTDLKTTLNNAPDKFVNIDLTGSTITTIPAYAFNTGTSPYTGCATLTGIIIPNGVTSIGNSAFSDCTSLISITIPDSVTGIGQSTFSDCTGLTSVTIPNSVTSIGRFAFYVCRSLTSVTIPNSVTSIGFNAFGHCARLTSVTFQGTITSDNFNSDAFGTNIPDINFGYIGDLRAKYLAGGPGTYTRPNTGEGGMWTKQE